MNLREKTTRMWISRSGNDYKTSKHIPSMMSGNSGGKIWLPKYVNKNLMCLLFLKMISK